MKRYTYYILLTLLLLSGVAPIKAQNQPYVDDKLLHFGFSLGVDFLSHRVVCADTTEQKQMYEEFYYTRTSAPTLGFNLNLISDFRLSRHLNLRFCPGMHFGTHTLTYRSSVRPDSLISGSACRNNKPSLNSLPIDIPLYLKWSAEREYNYRPYITIGGGLSYDVMHSTNRKNSVLLKKPVDYFLEAGIGCDFYFLWFKFCPEIRYRIGFNNMITPIDETENITLPDHFYTNAISELFNQQISIVLNFE